MRPFMQGELISGDQNGSIKIWDLTANACTHELVPEEGVPIRSVSVAADGSLLVASNSKVRFPSIACKLWFAVILILIASSVDNRQGNCYIWRMENGRDTTDLKPILKLEAHDTYVLKCLLSPDVRYCPHPPLCQMSHQSFSFFFFPFFLFRLTACSQPPPLTAPSKSGTRATSVWRR